jgi:predicted nucleic acid-binding protein
LTGEIRHLLIDTSYLGGVTFGDVELQKLLRHSREGELKIFIPHIVWEERRTQLLEETKNDVTKLRTAYQKVFERTGRDLVLTGLQRPALGIWSDLEMDANSRSAMAAFAAEHKIEIVHFASDHATRAWDRFFSVGLPYNANQPREHRRKDIPDAWILETAIDLARLHPSLVALCPDSKLSAALTAIPIAVVKTALEVLDRIEAPISEQSSTTVGTGATEQPGPAMTEAERVVLVPPSDELARLLDHAQTPSRSVDIKIAGFVTFLAGPTKGQLVDLLTRSGVANELIGNGIGRLILSGIIRDTGNHYLPIDRKIGDLAAAVVENDIINLLNTKPL